MQMVTVFFDGTEDRRMPHLPAKPSEDQIRMALATNNQNCPLNQIIYGVPNEGNMRILKRFAFTAFKRPDHSCRGCNFGIFASSGQGKTYVVKQFAKTIGIPFVFVQSKSLKDTWSLFEMIREEFDRHEFDGKNWAKITEHRDEIKGTDYTIPPCIVFFDEAHALPKSMMTAGLLNAMEPDDGIMHAKPSGSKGDIVRINCHHICWVAATTERGMLFDAFENRLGTAIEWASAGADELAQIVQAKFANRKDIPLELDEEACYLVTRYRRVPREAISFAEKMLQQKDMFPSNTWEEAAKIVAADIGVDEGGFSKKQIAILKALGKRPVAESRLPSVAKCRIEQVQRYELPFLMEYSGDGPYIVAIPGKGMCITESGLKELEKRNIAHKGYKVTAEYFESRR